VDPGLAEMKRLHAQAEALGHARLRLRAAEALARAALAAGDLQTARTAAREGLEEASDRDGYLRAWRLHRLLASVLEREGKRPEAEAERRQAAAEIARVSQGLAPEQRQSFNRIAEVQQP
jgi:hypothetical protein